MRSLLRATASVVLTAAINLSPAAAAGSVNATSPNLPRAGSAATPTPHYEWQYHYAGRHARLLGHWVLVR
jgi:hypothetical protein